MSSSFILEQRQLVKLQVIITGIRIVQINHISISMSEEFAEKKVNKLFVVHFRKHWSSDCVEIE